MAEKNLSHVRALECFRLNGEHVAIGDEVPKTAFASKGDWHELTVMTPKRAEECDPTPRAEKATKVVTGLPQA